MHEPSVQLQRVQDPRRRWSLPRTLALVAGVGLLTFLLGLSVGGGAPQTPTTPRADATPLVSAPPAITEAQVSRELWTAYLNRGDTDWGLCQIGVQITCQPITTVSGPFFTDADPFPGRVTDAQWAAFDPMTVGPGHYVLAGPARGIAPQAIFEGVGDGGYPTYMTGSQVVWNGALWLDVGTLGRGSTPRAPGTTRPTQAAPTTKAE